VLSVVVDILSQCGDVTTFGSAGGNLCVGKYEKLNPFPVSEMFERLVAT